MLFRVDPLSPDPIFEQLAFQVKGAIARGELGPGDRLPSVRELAREVGVNPNTVVRTYETLEAERVIVRKQGAGTFVAGGKSVLADAPCSSSCATAQCWTVRPAMDGGFRDWRCAPNASSGSTLRQRCSTSRARANSLG